MLDLFCKEVILEPLESYIEMCFSTGAATNRLSKKILTLNSLITPILTFVGRKLEYKIAYQTTYSQTHQRGNLWQP